MISGNSGPMERQHRDRVCRYDERRGLGAVHLAVPRRRRSFRHETTASGRATLKGSAVPVCSAEQDQSRERVQYATLRSCPLPNGRGSVSTNAGIPPLCPELSVSIGRTTFKARGTGKSPGWRIPPEGFPDTWAFDASGATSSPEPRSKTCNLVLIIFPTGHRGLLISTSCQCRPLTHAAWHLITDRCPQMTALHKFPSVWYPYLRCCR